MKALVAAVVHARGGLPSSRSALIRLLGITPAAILLSGLLFVVAAPFAAPVAAKGVPSGDWTQFHNGVTHLGYNTQETTLSVANAHTLRPAWTGATGFPVDSSPVVANGVVYVGSSDDKLYAYAVGCASNGSACAPLWTANTGSGIESSPAVAGGVVYVGNDAGSLYAFDANGVTRCSGVAPLKTCLPLWVATTGSSIKGAPTIANGRVFVGSEDHKLYAFAVACASGGATCLPLWTASTGGMIMSSPAYSNNVIYVGSLDSFLYAFDANGVTRCSGGPTDTCLPLWKGPSYEIESSSPTISGGVVYVGSDDFKLYAYAVGCNSGGGLCTPLWTGPTGSYIASTPAVANGVIYVGSYDNKLYAYAVGCNSGGASTCSPLWTATTGGHIFSSPAVANGVVYVGSEDGKMYAFDAAGATSCTGTSPSKTCKPLWTATTGGTIDSSPAITNGVVYVGSEDHRLYAFSLSAATHLGVSLTTSFVAGAAHTVTVTAKDMHGYAAGAYRGTIHFTSSDPAAVLPADYTFAAADAGVHTFSLGVRLKTAGSRSVTATDTVSASITGTKSGITVTPAAAKNLTLTLTGSFAVGASHSVTVTAKDAYGNTATGYTGTIHFTSSDAAAVLPANYIFVPGDNGTHAFSLGVKLQTAGTQWVRATDTVTATITGVKTGIIVS
jgi:outer membrane protein assembly factor BamB